MSAIIQNKYVCLKVDNKGRILSLKNKTTGTELIKFKETAETFRLVFHISRYVLDLVDGRKQKPAKIKVTKESGSEKIELFYDKVKSTQTKAVYTINAKFTLALDGASPEIKAYVEIENKNNAELQEIEFPVINGLKDFSAGTKEKPNFVAANDRGFFYPNIFYEGFPEQMLEGDQFARREDTVMFLHDNWNGVWCDLYNSKQGIYFGYHSKREDIFSFRAVRSPKEFPRLSVHVYPKGTPRWLGVTAIHIPRIKPGGSWKSDIVRVVPHAGDWHSGADIYAAYRKESIKIPKSPKWFEKDFYGWSAVVGKIYTGEKFFDFKTATEGMLKEIKKTGIKMLFYYGHTAIGAEGADFNNMPAKDLGGANGFKKMVGRVHKAGGRIILLDHFHRWVNKEVPEYKKYNMKKYEVLNEKGQPVEDCWGKETVLSLKYFKGPSSVWREMCPAEEGFREHYFKNIENLAKLSIDGTEMDLYMPSQRCFNPKHSHPVGALLKDYKLEFTRIARERARKINPEFIFFGESLYPESAMVLDSFFSRFYEERENINRYLFPYIQGQQARIENYTYDNVNKALLLGVAVDTEMDGVREYTYIACPELAKYIKETNEFKKKYYDIMLRGMYRDTVGAKVSGDIIYSVLDAGYKGKALVLRNRKDVPVKVKAAFTEPVTGKTILWQPFKGEKKLSKFPAEVMIGSSGAAVIIVK